MTKETKVTLITGFTFITIFFALMIAEVLLHDSICTIHIIIYVFIFDKYFFEQKTEC